MMKKWLVFGALVLSGCGTDIATYHAQCMAQGKSFPAQVSCVRADVAQDSILQNDRLVQGYLASGDELARQVKTGKLTDAQARAQFSGKLNKIKQAQLDALAAQARRQHEEDELRPHFTSCFPTGTNGVQCAHF